MAVPNASSLGWIIANCDLSYAPNQKSDEELAAWWTATSQSIPATVKTWPLVALLDANARVGSIESPSIGSRHAEEGNSSGAIFHEWLLQEDLILPQTMTSHHEGESAAWWHSSGSSARLDYIAVSSSLSSSWIRTRISSVDLTMSKRDHAAVELDLMLNVWKADRSKPFKSGRAAFAPGAKTLASTPWSMNVHTHAAHLHDSIAARYAVQRQRLPRKRHLSEPTWQLIKWKQYHRRRQRQIQHDLQTDLLRACFSAWRTQHAHPLQENSWRCLARRQLTLHQLGHEVLCPKIVQAVRSDDARYYTDLAARTGEIAADEGLTGLWKQIKFILPRQQAKRRSSLRCIGPECDEEAAHYCALEGGEPQDYPRLLAACHDAQRAKMTDAPLQISLLDIPTRLDIERAGHRAKPHKAPGIDGLSLDDFRHRLPELSGELHHLTMKSWITGAEPAQHKGGLLWTITKKAGATDIASCRGIMLLEVLGKLHHAVLRRRLIDWAMANRCHTQYGGFAGQQISFASQHLRTYVHLLTKHACSNSVVFLDVKSAFHCLLREHAFGTSCTFPPVLAALLTQEGLDVAQLQADSARHAELFTTSAPPSLVRVIQDAHEHTWFTTATSAACYSTSRGSRPGSPLADVA